MISQKIKQLRSDVDDLELKADVLTILSEIVRFPKILTVAIEGKKVVGTLVTQNEERRFEMDYSKTPTLYSIFPPEK